MTFFFIRNGDQLYRMNCDLEFGEMIFPDKDEFDPTQPMMFQLRHDDVFLITKDDYEVRCEEWQEERRADKRWRRQNPLKKWKAAWLAERAVKGKPGKVNNGSEEHPDIVAIDHIDFSGKWKRANPYCNTWGHPKWSDPEGEWEPFDPSSVYYDEVVEDIGERVQHYNRIALIIQGLHDRSPILHPHPPVKTWTGEGFASAVTLIYDGDRALYAGDAPDYEAYAEGLRELIDGDSVLMGQYDLWKEVVRAKEEKRRMDSWRYDYRDSEVGRWWTPNGNDGPGDLARVAKFIKRSRKVMFRWHRERKKGVWVKREWYPQGSLIADSITLPIDEHLFNVSAYKPGDFLQFFQDPRTRADYLQWAPTLLTAEEYHAGNEAFEAQEPIKR